MIKKAATRMLGYFFEKILGPFFARHERPWRPGLIAIKDEISRTTLLLSWRPDSFMETQFFQHGLYGGWERHSLRIWAHVSSDASEILDIGANTGIYSLLARKNNPEATIVAVEPIEINANVLQTNINANEAGVIVERVAMSEVSGEAVMYMLKDRLNYMTSINDNRYAPHPEIIGKSDVVPVTVPLLTWPDLQAKHSLVGPDLIKIDVEGHEVPVLRSLQTHIVQRRPTILLEVIGSENASAINDMLLGLNYVFISVDESGCKASIVDSLWDNDHQNFLICRRDVAQSLVSRGLVQGVVEH
jgi:FkbM family methyltransferase